MLWANTVSTSCDAGPCSMAQAWGIDLALLEVVRPESEQVACVDGRKRARSLISFQLGIEAIIAQHFSDRAAFGCA
ncbi:hypothetical protein B8W72_02475 [Pseudomonas putida]|uniref:Uncharacterized protein n=1 Tax=Pseudomonas putida TaxID=303 RepID=A0A1Y3LJ27_PSEPU|nr:hypothetical protein B8W72_02475 [Pseudomonas putida]